MAYVPAIYDEASARAPVMLGVDGWSRKGQLQRTQKLGPYPISFFFSDTV